MSTKIVAEKTHRCSLCGHAVLEQRVITERFTYGAEGEEAVVEAEGVPVEVCPACGEVFSGLAAAQVRHEAICRAFDLLPPREIRKLRERLGMTQAEFARLTGIGLATISRWERGRLLQTRAMDRYLRVLASSADNVEFLQKLEKPATTPDECPARPMHRFRRLTVTEGERLRAQQFQVVVGMN